MPTPSARSSRGARRGTVYGTLRSIGVGPLARSHDVLRASPGAAGRLGEEGAEGERRLLLAVLEDGIRTLLKHAGATRGRGRNLHREAMAWFSSDAHADVFAFASICEALEIDPGRLRGRVLAWMRRDAPSGRLH
ncbi:MAG TPA: hypothetical protein VGR62_15450 [Candidatus Binatia bacterium]|jgi:hypothetical protein|nr:hypothetical protein [Candidatus Binatia bacterium]